MSPFSAIDYFPVVVDNGDDSSSISASTITTCSSQPLHHTATTEEDDCSSSSRQRKAAGVVSFNDCIEVNFVLHYKDYTIEEKSSSWYNGDEIRTIKNGVRKDVQILTNTPNSPDTDDYTSRGIEGRTKSGSKEKRQLKVDARAAVFFEQSCQQDEDCTDDEQIADCYYDYSEPASIKAHMIAIRDEQIAKSIYQECSFKTIRDSFVVFVFATTSQAIIENPVQSPVIASSAA